MSLHMLSLQFDEEINPKLRRAILKRCFTQQGEGAEAMMTAVKQTSSNDSCPTTVSQMQVGRF